MFSDVWKALLVALGAVFVLEAFGLHTQVSNMVAYGFIDAAWSLALIPLLDLSKRCRIHPAIAGGIGWAVYSAAFFAGALVAGGWGTVSLTTPVSLAMLLAVVLAVVFCADSGDVCLQGLLSDLNMANPPVEDWRTIDDRVKAMGRDHGLSEREIEVACYLAKGRTRAFIALSRRTP